MESSFSKSSNSREVVRGKVQQAEGPLKGLSIPAQWLEQAA